MISVHFDLKLKRDFDAFGAEDLELAVFHASCGETSV